jgi:hypothetical protein
MTRFYKSSFAAITVLLASGAVALPAFARSVPAYAGGRSADPADASCFLESWGAARNNCATTKSYTMSLPVDSAGNHSVTVFAKGADASSNVGCRAIGMGPTGQTWGGGFVYLPSFPAVQPIFLAPAFVPDGGALYVYCVVDPGGQINSVNY